MTDTTTYQEPAGIWQRVSSGGQDEASQLPDLLAWCASHNYAVADGCRYVVHGKSAYKGKHQAALDQVLADMRLGRIKVLVVWASSRIERRGAWSAFDLARKVREAGGRIEFVKDSYLNSANDMSDVMLALAASKDFRESKDKSDRVLSKQAFIRARGGLVGRPPWGYTSNGEKYSRKLIPTDAGRTYVPEIFKRCIDGDSLDSIGRWLSAETGRPMWAGTLATMIKCPTYIGRRCEWDEATRTYGKVIATCEALVDPITFKRAGQSLAGRPKRGPANAANRAMLAGTIYCPRCENSPMYRIAPPDREPCYRCSGRGSQRKGCGNLILVAAADALVSHFMDCMDSPILRADLIPGHDHAAGIENIRLAIRDLADASLSDAEYDAELARLRAERNKLAAMPAVPDRVEWVSTGRTYAEMWATLSGPERGEWLRSVGVTVHGIRSDVACLVEKTWALKAMGAASVLSGDGVTLAVSWLGSGADWTDAD